MFPKYNLQTLLCVLILCLQGIHSTVIPESVPHQCAVPEDCTGVGETCDVETKLCVCTGDFVRVGEKCFKKATMVEDHCEHALQCTSNLGKDSLCYGNTCLCDATKAFDNFDLTKCLSFADSVGSECEMDQQCTASSLGARSFCESNKTCQCRKGALPSGNKANCLETKDQLDDQCVETVQCLVPNSSCEGSRNNKRCQCIPGEFVASIETPLYKCLKVSKNPEDPCEEEIQCTTGMGNNSECSENTKCACKSNHIFAQGKCHKQAGFSEECGIHEQCTVKNSECSTLLKKCTCKSGFLPDTDQDSFICSGCSFVQISFFLIAVMHGITKVL